MGKIDITAKEYMSDNKKFSDVFNYFLYGGREVLRPERLQERDPSELLTYINEKAVGEKKERDLLRNVIMKTADGV